MNKTTTRILLTLTVLCLLLIALVGCRKTVDASDDKAFKDMAFTYFIPTGITVFDHGQTAQIYVVTINEGNSIAYRGSSPTIFIGAALVIEHEGKTYRIEAKEIPADDDGTDRVWERGESVSRGFDFVIPADAPVGHYDLEVRAGDATRTFSDVLELHIHTNGSTHTPSTETDEHGHQH